MIAIVLLWLKFIVASLGLLFFGYKASKQAYKISKITVFSETFMGMVFLAISTSMPELFSSIGAAGIAHSSNLAVGNILGTLIINLIILIMLDFQIKKPVVSYGNQHHVLSGLLCIFLLSLVTSSIILQYILQPVIKFFHVGLDSIFIFIMCLIALRLVFIFEKRNNNLELDVKDVSGGWKIWTIFFIYIFFVGSLGIWIADIADNIADITSWCNHTYFGSVFLAISSSLPEIIVSIFSVGVGSVNMAMGNILGSNLFDIIIIPISDLFYTNGIILSDVSLTHIFTAISAIVLISLFSIGIISKTKKSFLKFNWVTISMICVFIIYYFFLTLLTN